MAISAAKECVLQIMDCWIETIIMEQGVNVD